MIEELVYVAAGRWRLTTPDRSLLQLLASRMAKEIDAILDENGIEFAAPTRQHALSIVQGNIEEWRNIIMNVLIPDLLTAAASPS
jgi:hypothetical protein